MRILPARWVDGARPHLGSRRPVVAAAVLIALGCMAAGPARAATYDVYGCDAGGSVLTDGWTAGTAGSGMAAYGLCATNGDATRGLVARNCVGCGVAPQWSRAWVEFNAPSGTSIDGLWTSYRATRNDGDYYLSWSKDAGTVLSQSCGTNDGVFACAFGPDYGNSPAWIPVNGSNVRIEVGCGNPGGCLTSALGTYPSWRARINVYSTTVRLIDSDSPGVWLTGGGLASAGWLRGNQDLTFNASDASGISETQLVVDGAGYGVTTRPCDYHYRVPCSNYSSQHYSLNTSALSDGVHDVRVYAADATKQSGAGNWTHARNDIYVDNHAPAKPAVSVDGGSAWRTTNSFSLRWTNPSQAGGSVHTQAKYQLCRVGGTCGATQAIALSAAEQSGGAEVAKAVSVPQPGEYTAKVWLRDAAGNEDPQLASEPVTLRFDDVAPGRAFAERSNGWLNAQEAADYHQSVTLKIGEVEPVSGIAGYSVSVDGTDPDGTIDVFGKNAAYEITDIPEGLLSVKARAVSAAGVASPLVDTAELKVDKSPPQVRADGAPDSVRWETGKVTVSAIGVDQPGLSGMTPAPGDQPVDEGAYVSYRIDGADARRVRGAGASIEVASDGRHTITYQAHDVAGNPSIEKSLSFKIDATAPVGAFKARDPRDPRKLELAMFDATSGVESGEIQIRRVGTSDWERLVTSRDGDTLATVLDDSRPDGQYEVRAHVRDNAGNEGTVDAFEDGSKARLEFPLRIPTLLTASTAVEVRTACRSVIRRVRVASGRIVRKRFRVCKKRRVPSTRKGKRVTLRPGQKKTPVVRGLLLTTEGTPLADAVVDVEQQPRTGGGFKRVGTLRTDSRGGFRYTIPAGPSRTVRFAFAGSSTIKPSGANVTVLAPGTTTLKVNRRRVRNGQSVRFSGRLAGGEVPRTGKVVELQARVGRKWVTFRTVRTTPAGAWRANYRFRSTTGVRTYTFRAFLRREGDYPYEAGASKTTAVTVRGR